MYTIVGTIRDDIVYPDANIMIVEPEPKSGNKTEPMVSHAIAPAANNWDIDTEII